MSLLEVESLSIVYRARGALLRAVNDVSISLGPGESVGIVGDSGCGKSTLLFGMLGMVRQGGRITAGSVRMGGTDLVGASYKTLAEVRSSQVGFIPQNAKAAMNPMQSVGAQLTAVLKERGRASTRQQAFEMGVTLLRGVGIADAERRWTAYPHELSGGMAQRVLIAAALARRPSLIFADEPTSGLDVTLQAQILDDLRAISEHEGLSLCIVTHDAGVVAHYTDRVYVMNAGEVVERCPTADLFARPRTPVGLAMIAASQGITAPEVRLKGRPLDRRRLPVGCYLAPRCGFASEAAGCRSVHPELTEVGEDHLARCHRHDELPALRDLPLHPAPVPPGASSPGTTPPGVTDPDPSSARVVAS